MKVGFGEEDEDPEGEFLAQLQAFGGAPPAGAAAFETPDLRLGVASEFERLDGVANDRLRKVGRRCHEVRFPVFRCGEIQSVRQPQEFSLFAENHDLSVRGRAGFDRVAGDVHQQDVERNERDDVGRFGSVHRQRRGNPEILGDEEHVGIGPMDHIGCGRIRAGWIPLRDSSLIPDGLARIVLESLPAGDQFGGTRAGPFGQFDFVSPFIFARVAKQPLALARFGIRLRDAQQHVFAAPIVRDSERRDLGIAIDQRHEMANRILGAIDVDKPVVHPVVRQEQFAFDRFEEQTQPVFGLIERFTEDHPGERFGGALLFLEPLPFGFRPHHKRGGGGDTDEQHGGQAGDESR